MGQRKLAAMLPFERHLRWVEQKKVAAKMVEDLLGGVEALAAALIGKAKFAGPKGFIAGLVGRESMSAAVNFGADQLRKMNAEALAKHEYLKAVLTRFILDRDDGEEKRVLLRSRR